MSQSQLSQKESTPSKTPLRKFRPSHKVHDSGVAWEVTIELPGVAKGDIVLKTEGSQIEILANRLPLPENWRSIEAPHHADAYALRLQFHSETPTHLTTAKYETGILTLHVPKELPKQRTQISID